MKRILILLAFFACANPLAAQDLKRITIKGIVSDTAAADMPFATVMLLNPSDSNLVNFTRCDDKGAFAFKNVKNTAYLIKASYVGYIPFQQYVPVSTAEINDLGTLRMKLINTELNEVVIKAARSTLTFRGDTIEYDAASFKVPPGSTVEDLLRRLPGIDVDAEGNIKAQGKDVQRLYVDGKTFFGNDPKAATQNLGAETISKVQIYDEKSEQSKLTGVDDGKETKAMNLELKDEFKKGTFGKISAAVGTENRWSGRGNFNKFNKKGQFSVIGYGNNINQTGLTWDDLGEFKGQNTWNNNDNVDFGFNSGGGGRVFSFDDNDIPISFNDGRGFTKNYGGGTNYNYDHKKIKANISYFYNQTDLDLDQYSYRQTFTPVGSFSNTDTLVRDEFRDNHNVSGRLEYEIDSSNTLILNAKARVSGKNDEESRLQRFNEAERLLSINNGSELASHSLNGSAIFRHKFRKKKGRSFAVSSAFGQSENDWAEEFFSNNRQLANMGNSTIIRQKNDKTGANSGFRASALYTEPITKKWFWELFTNYAHSDNTDNRQVFNPDNEGKRVDSLSLWFNNTIGYRRAGTSVRYNYNGVNVSGGVAAQQFKLKGKYAFDADEPLLDVPFERTYNNFVPYIDLSYEPTENSDISGSYNYEVSTPDIDDLRPVPNVSNPLFRSEGNPDLRTTHSHEISVGYSRWNPATFNNLYTYIDLNLYDDQVAYNQTIEFIDSLGVRSTTRPENVDGAYEVSSYANYGFPIIKTKLTMNINGGFNLEHTPSFINGVRNETDNINWNLRPRLSYTPNPNLILSADGSFNWRNARYSIQSEQNQKIRSYTANASIKWQVIPKTFLESNFNYSKFKNVTLGFEREVPLLNASVRRLLGKSNKIELRLAAFDVFNRRVTVNQNVSQTFISNSVSNTLARYYMLSVSYNMRGYENKLKKNDWW